MAHHSKTAFTFGPEFRTRLRELRKRRGRTLRAMALLRANVEKWAPKLNDPKFASEAAKVVADIYNQWKVRLPPK